MDRISSKGGGKYYGILPHLDKKIGNILEAIEKPDPLQHTGKFGVDIGVTSKTRYKIM